MISRRLGLLWLVTTLVACNDDASQFVFQAQIVDADDGNPAAGTDADNLSVMIAEGDFPIRSFDFPITDGQFDASLEFASFSSLTRLRVDIEGPSTQLITAPPAFVPATSFGFVKVVAAAPSSCQRVSFSEMQAPRSRFGMVQSGTFALLAGGTSVSDEQVEFFDALEWETRSFDEDFAISFLGETRVATVGNGQILVIPSVAGSFVFDMVNASNRVTSVELHDGAGPQSALVAVPGLGALVIGGETSTGPTSRVTLVQPGAELSALELSAPRSGAVAAAIEQDVLVVGGDPDGTAELLIAGGTMGEPVAGVSDGARAGGLLISDGTTRALLLGGTDGDGALRDDTLRFDGCPDPCSASPGPTWTNARLGAVVPENGTLIVGGESSQMVESVVWSGGSVSIDPVVQLAVARANAGAIVYESGAFVVGGGGDGPTVRDDFEFCVPASLRPLSGAGGAGGTGGT